MTHYELKFDFGIDQQELHGLSPQEIFTLGFEFSVVYFLLNNQSDAFAMTVRARNTCRIRAYARQIKRKVQLGPIQHGWRKMVAEGAV